MSFKTALGNAIYNSLNRSSGGCKMSKLVVDVIVELNANNVEYDRNVIVDDIYEYIEGDPDLGSVDYIWRPMSRRKTFVYTK